MKKLFSALLAGALLLATGLSLAACSLRGTFCSLEEAYEAELLTQEELLSIAYYQNGGREKNEALMPEGYAPQERQELPEETDRAIRKTAAREWQKKLGKRVTADDMRIVKYYGAYHGCHAVMLNEPFVEFPAVDLENWVSVGGVQICYASPLEIVIWRQN